MSTVFAYAGTDLAALQQSCAQFYCAEICDTEVSITGSQPHEIKIDKVLAEPVSLMRVVSNTSTSFRRTWQHIRSHNAGVRVLLFVRSGLFKIVRSQSSCCVESGEFAILNSSQPYFAQASIDDDDVPFEAVVIVVPAHLFLSHLSEAVSLDRPIQLAANQLIQRLIDLLLEEGESLCKATAQPLVTALLEALGDAVGAVSSDGAGRRVRVADKRLADIVSYISKNFTSPGLTYDEVASRCGISPRYLCHLLKANNTSFSDLLWNQRLPQAKQWLSAEDFQDYSIQEIAFMAGFKSAAHFSRMFKDRYGCSPKMFRAISPDEATQEVACALN